MNSRSITDYILKLEKLSTEQAERIRELTFNEIEIKKESRAKIEQLKNLLSEASKDNSLYHTTARTKTYTLNKNIAEHLKELGQMTSDFYKAAAYNTAADTITALDFEVQNGESLLEIKGIGKGISSKVDQFLDEHFDDAESVASTEGQIFDESDYSSDDDYFVSYNSELADVFDELAHYEKDEHKSKAYDNAAQVIDRLPFKVTSGKELAKGPKKVKGIGKSIANVIDEFLSTGKVEKLEKLEKGASTNEEVARALDDYAENIEDRFKVRAYRNAAEVICNLDYEVTSGNDMRHLKGFGPSICSKIDKFLQTGKMN